MAEDYVDLIKDCEIQRVSEREARQEGLFILRRPTLVPGNSEVKQFNASTPRTIRAGRPSYSLDYSNNNVKSELIDHFNWEISKYRRLKNLTRKQLASLAGTGEENIKMLENGELPADNFSLIGKIEHYLGIALRKTSSSGSVGMAKPSSNVQVPSSESISRLRPVDPKTVTLAELQKRRESLRASSSGIREPTRPSRDFGAKKDSKSSSSGISGGDIELID